VESEQASAVAAGAEESPRKPFPIGSDFSVVGLTSVPASEHLAEQEDYLWGV
jgi:hypothetical protein